MTYSRLEQILVVGGPLAILGAIVLMIAWDSWWALVLYALILISAFVLYGLDLLLHPDPRKRSDHPIRGKRR